jgi:hypothetical protein
MAFPKGPKGIETAAARRLLARLRAFAEVTPVDTVVSEATAEASEGECTTIERIYYHDRDIFTMYLYQGTVPH